MKPPNVPLVSRGPKGRWTDFADRPTPSHAAAQKFADYENDIRVLEAKLRQEQRRNAAAAKAQESGEGTAIPHVTASQQPAHPGISRFGSFMHARKVSPLAPASGHSSMAATREQELERELVKEQTARLAAEQKVKDASAEIEELSESLFQQANEMVASERKENARLQARIGELEVEKAERGAGGDGNADLAKENARLKERLERLEQRDADRYRRLEKLEAAHERIERVNAMLLPR